MRIAVDISLYPLDADFIPPIKDVIERLNGQPQQENAGKPSVRPKPGCGALNRCLGGHSHARILRREFREDTQKTFGPRIVTVQPLEVFATFAVLAKDS